MSQQAMLRVSGDVGMDTELTGGGDVAGANFLKLNKLIII